MPGFSPDNFKYVSSCLWCTLSKFSTDFISMITISSTNISSLKPAFNLTSSYITGKVSWRLSLVLFRIIHGIKPIHKRFQINRVLKCYPL